ncbi:MAG TPA: thioredoxin family protein [Blastocatellia bacterium]|nr:thioredoxin family protein [Blastocatellia bacterium]
MKTKTAGLVFLSALICLVKVPGQRQEEAAKSGYAPVTTFDPARDPVKDLQDAIAEAKRTRRRILLDVGGEWCGWCHAMDRFLELNTELKAFRDQNFVWLKINFSPENENKAFLSRYPEIPGYPHIFVLDTDGRLMHSQNTGPLEKGKSYDLDKYSAFLKRWSPKQP